MFPKANDYINFLKPLWKNQKSILEVDLFRNRLKHQESTNHLANKVDKLDENILNDCLVENDYWHVGMYGHRYMTNVLVKNKPLYLEAIKDAADKIAELALQMVKE